MAIMLPKLPYAQDALEPIISERTLDFHYNKHHNAYVTNANNMIKGTDFEDLDMEIIITKTAGDVGNLGIFNNTAQAFNHAFYWKCMKPGGGDVPSGLIAAKINQAFGSYEKFAEEFKAAGMTQFGSGWVWLVRDSDRLKIMKTPNADTPLAHGVVPLLTVDVWEHAYYLDYQNRRLDYLGAFLDKLANWDFVNANLKE